MTTTTKIAKIGGRAIKISNQNSSSKQMLIISFYSFRQIASAYFNESHKIYRMEFMSRDQLKIAFSNISIGHIIRVRNNSIKIVTCINL